MTTCLSQTADLIWASKIPLKQSWNRVSLYCARQHAATTEHRALHVQTTDLQWCSNINFREQWLKTPVQTLWTCSWATAETLKAKLRIIKRTIYRRIYLQYLLKVWGHLNWLNWKALITLKSFSTGGIKSINKAATPRILTSGSSCKMHISASRHTSLPSWLTQSRPLSGSVKNTESTSVCFMHST